MEKDKNDLEEVSLDEFEFKPITDGLGFHNKPEKRRTIVKKPRSESESFKRIKHHKHVKSVRNVEMGELSSFYGLDRADRDIEQASGIAIQPEISKRTEIELPEQKEVKVKISELTGAFLVDSLIVLAAVFVTVSVSLYAIGMDISALPIVMLMDEFLIFSAILYAIYFLFYFTFMEVTQTSTFGKSIVGIRTVSFDGENLDLGTSLLRSIIILVSFMAFGLPLFLDFHGKLSNSKTIYK